MLHHSLRPEVRAEVGATEAAEVEAAEVEETTLQIKIIKIKTRRQVHQDGRHKDMLMGLQVTPVLTIIPMAVLHFFVVIH